MLGKRYIRVGVRAAGGFAGSSAYGVVCVCVCVCGGHSTSSSSVQSFGEVLVTPMGRTLSFLGFS